MRNLRTPFGRPRPTTIRTSQRPAHGPALLQNIWLLEKMAHFDREVIPERRMHAKGSGACTFTVTHDITKYTKAKNLLRDREEDPNVCPLLNRRRRTACR